MLFIRVSCMKKASWIRNKVPVYRRKEKSGFFWCVESQIERRKAETRTLGAASRHDEQKRKVFERHFPPIVDSYEFRKAIICLNLDNQKPKKRSEEEENLCNIFPFSDPDFFCVRKREKKRAVNVEILGTVCWFKWNLWDVSCSGGLWEGKKEPPRVSLANRIHNSPESLSLNFPKAKLRIFFSH